MGEAAAQPVFWHTWAKRSKLEMNFHFIVFDTPAQLRVVIVAGRARK